MVNNEDIGLLRVSCNNLETGKIKWCNDKMTSIVGFPKFELTKMKINRLIPPIIANRHTDYIKNFIINPKEVFLNKIRVSYMINDSNFLVPIIIYIKLVQEIKNGIEIIGMVHKVIDNTFVLYKFPELKNNAKICFCLINEDGSIEAVDRNANIYLGLPNFVRDGSKLKLAIDNRKCNLFALSPVLKESIKNGKFRSEINLDTTILSEDYYNDENGIFLSINSRIKHLVMQKVPDNVEGMAFNHDYYEDDVDEESNDSTKEKTIKFKKLQSNNIKYIFKEHNVLVDIYNFQSSNNDLKTFLIKFYYVPESLINFQDNNALLNNVIHITPINLQLQQHSVNNTDDPFNQNQMQEKLKSRKDLLYDDKIVQQVRYFRWMQAMFIFLVIILSTLVSYELFLNIKAVLNN